MFYRFVLFTFFIALTTFALGQPFLHDSHILNYQRGDRLNLHLGFSLGVNFMDYRALMSGENELRSESGSQGIGFLVGFVSELRLSNNMGLRFMPGVEMSSRRLVFSNVPDVEGGIVGSQVNHVYLTLPLMLKYKAKRINNYRPFITAGPSVKYDFANHAHIDPFNDIYLRTKAIDTFLEMGLGSDFYLPYFKFGVELRFSLGLFDVLNHEPDPEMPGYDHFTYSLKKLNARMFTIVFHFE
ncbi:hypothetical protein FACS1894199_15520 [Bacteroidia bacterium]|nr:hypothetical protein FACS1894199_15520 [Bacteroidia bacterium]